VDSRVSIEFSPNRTGNLCDQIVAVIRWQIGTGSLKPLDPLPSLRGAERAWGVNRHTVRQAYRLLEAEGVLQTKRGAGTIVAPGIPQPSGPAFRTFLLGTIRTARERFGVSAEELAQHITGAANTTSLQFRVVAVVECNLPQAQELSELVAARWPVRAIPWLVSQAAPPPGLILGTLFHAAEIRKRWKHRVADMAFGALDLEARFGQRVKTALAKSGRHVLYVCERDQDIARCMAEHIRQMLPAGILMKPILIRNIDVALSDPQAAAILVAPRVWLEIPESIRRRSNVVRVSYEFSEVALGEFAVRLGLAPKPRGVSIAR
jgi:DNA-binding transcriptional regulator YhcF (GntR family)